MPSGQFNIVVISVSDILPLDKGHYISVSIRAAFPALGSEEIDNRGTAPGNRIPDRTYNG